MIVRNDVSWIATIFTACTDQRTFLGRGHVKDTVEGCALVVMVSYIGRLIRVGVVAMTKALCTLLEVGWLLFTNILPRVRQLQKRSISTRFEAKMVG